MMFRYHVKLVLRMILDQLELSRRRHVGGVCPTRFSASWLANLSSNNLITCCESAFSMARPVQTILLLRLFADQRIAFVW